MTEDLTMMGTTDTALRMIRYESIPLDHLARCFCESEGFAAGLVDIVTGDQDWRVLFDPACPATAEEQQAYARGAMLAERLLDAERKGLQCAGVLPIAMTEAGRLAANLVACDRLNPDVSRLTHCA